MPFLKLSKFSKLSKKEPGKKLKATSMGNLYNVSNCKKIW